MFAVMEGSIEFYTATCLNWKPLLLPDEHKDIIMDSLRYLVLEEWIRLYGFVIMPNHIHFLWSKRERALRDKIESKVQLMFSKFTAQQIKFCLQKSTSTNKITNPEVLKAYASTQSDRSYQFWERRPWKATMTTKFLAQQKLNYIHQNPVRSQLCIKQENYHYSSYRFYHHGEDNWGFISHMENRIW